MQIRRSTYHKLLREVVIAALTVVVLIPSAFANPQGGVVSNGNAVISTQGDTTTIQQNSQQAIINWQSFNIANGEKTQFNQPNSHASALNRINPLQGASQIYGSLSANGQIILINAAGIHFGPSAMVNVGGIIASTSDISDENFLAGKYVFDQASQFHGSIINEGRIIAADHGLVALVGSNVTNTGQIQAQMGNIILATGNKFTFDFYGDQLINFTVNGATTDGGKITNSGSLLADGGKILLNANAAQSVLDNVINMQGTAQANSVSESNGVIILEANGGNIDSSGTLLAAGDAFGTSGGTIKLLSTNDIHLASTSLLDASGDVNGGVILIGGNFRGQGPEINALNTTIDKGAMIKADAISSGNGGKVVVWSNNATAFHGSISAQGGITNGNGGFVETSGKHLDVQDSFVNLTSRNGNIGTWLLDPTNLVIKDNGGNYEYINQYSDNSYVGMNDQDTSIIDVNLLIAALNTANIKIETTSGGAGTGIGDITLEADIANTAWTAATTLTLSAYHDININASLSNSNGGSLVLQADNTGTGSGTVNFGAGGVVDMSGGGSVNVYYNPAVFGTQDASIADVTNAPNTTNFVLSGGTTFTAYMLVNSLTDLENINNNLNGNYALGKDIDASSTNPGNGGSGFTALGSGSLTAFTGQFDGQGHVIDSLYAIYPIAFNGGGALFYGTATESLIQNLGLTNISLDFTNQDHYGVAPFAGDLSGGLKNSYVTGAVVNAPIGGGSTYNGGLVANMGGNYTSGTLPYILNSYSQLDDTSIGAALVGIYNQGTITNSYEAGPGLAGMAVQGFFPPGTIVNSFWDTEVGIGIPPYDPSDPTQQTTAAMKTQTTYCPSGNCAGDPNYFDFANTWEMPAGSYPTLQVFNPATPTLVATYGGPPTPPPPPPPDPTPTPSDSSSNTNSGETNSSFTSQAAAAEQTTVSAVQSAQVNNTNNQNNLITTSNYLSSPVSILVNDNLQTLLTDQKSLDLQFSPKTVYPNC